ncbi:unnamed protein product [Brassica oleracea var. botrytis]
MIFFLIGHKKAQGLTESQSPLLQILRHDRLFSFISISSSPAKKKILLSSKSSVCGFSTRVLLYHQHLRQRQ